MKNKNKLFEKNYFLMFFLLLAFWIIIAGTLSIESILVGAIASLTICYLNRDLFLTKDDGGPINFTFLFAFLRFIVPFLLEVIRSNIQVAIIVLSPKMPIKPSFVKIPVHAKKDFTKVLYGNVITLTPGSLTVDITNENEYIVHILTHENKLSLIDSRLEALILKMEGRK